MNPEYLAELHALIKLPVQPTIEYRLYYNQFGEITMGSMTMDTLTTDPYVIVTQQEYDRYFDYKIVAGKLKKIDHDAGYRVKLQKSNNGYCVVKNHAGLLLEPEDTHTTIEYYAHRNN